MTVLMFLLVFVAGIASGDLIRWAQTRHRAHLLVNGSQRLGWTPESALRIWAGHPENWCTRPGCARCWGRWGR